MTGDEYEFIRISAEKYGVQVRTVPLAEGVRGYKIDNVVVLNELEPPERRNWTFCHETAHVILGHNADPSDSEEREADKMAAEMMLPADDFLRTSRDLDLEKLKSIYPHASWEALARRVLQFNPAVLTIFDEGKLTLRRASGELNFTPAPLKEELNLSGCCYKNKCHHTEYYNDTTVKGYYIDEGRGVRRVILLTIFENFGS